MAYGPYNYGPELMDRAQAGASAIGRNIADTVDETVRPIVQASRDNRPNYQLIAGSTGPARNRPEIPSLQEIAARLPSGPALPNINFTGLTRESYDDRLARYNARQGAPATVSGTGAFNTRFDPPQAPAPTSAPSAVGTSAGRLPGPVNPTFVNPAIEAYEGLGLTPPDLLTGLEGTGRPPLASAGTQAEFIGGYPYSTQPSAVNYIRGEDGRVLAINPNDPNGSQLASSVNTFDLQAANRAGAEANAIRQSAIDSLAGPGGGPRIVTLGPEETPASLALQRVQDLYDQAEFERDPRQRSALLRQAQGAERDLSALRGSADTQYRVDQEAENVLNRQANTRGIAELRAATDLETSALRNEGIGAYRRAAAAADLARANPAPTFDGQSILDAEAAAQQAGIITFDPATGQITPQYRQYLTNFLEAGLGLNEQLLRDQTPREAVGLAEGGMVPAPVPSAVGGELGPVTPPLMPPSIMQNYAQYSAGATQMGLPPVSFEEFAKLGSATQAGQANQPMTFADGGMVPDASGKMVTDLDPNAPTDSIPAVIDEQQPARLDSGEFVLPRDVVLFFGTDKLQKMIATARDNGDQNGGQSAIA